ncbi:MAG: hypothetical protein LBI99_09880 [Propionibacteriaceae bacterium]|jgi:hypothetical protein|nr:hypothetical protein [Propionibacteriaceae bacterium]
MSAHTDSRHSRGRGLLLLGLAIIVAVVAGLLVWRFAAPQTVPEPVPTPTETSPSSTPSVAETAEAILAYAPAKATVTLDGQVIEPRITEGLLRNVKVTPGEHTFTFSMPGFASYTKTVFVEDGDSNPVYAVLYSNSPDTAHYYDKQSEDSNTSDWIGVQYMNLDASQKYLPINVNGYKIEVKDFHDLDNYYLLVTCDLSATTHDTCKKNAKKTIQDTSDPGLGLRPALYTIIYKDVNG